MSGNSIVIMSGPSKSDNHDYAIQVSGISIQSGVTTSGQVYWYHMKACQVSDSMSIAKCHISGVRYRVSSITCQVSVSDIECQVSGVKYNMSSTGVRYQVPEIRCQV